VDFFVEKIAPGGAERRKLAVHIAGKAHLDDLKEEKAFEGVVEVTDVDGVKQTLSFYPELKNKKAK
jgi:hypothetical protein